MLCTPNEKGRVEWGKVETDGPTKTATHAAAERVRPEGMTASEHTASAQRPSQLSP